jgi:hypothetical protein
MFELQHFKLDLLAFKKKYLLEFLLSAGVNITKAMKTNHFLFK